MTLNFEIYLDSVNVNQDAKYLGQRSFSSNKSHYPDTQTHTHAHTHRTDCSTWMVGNKCATPAMKKRNCKVSTVDQRWKFKYKVSFRSFSERELTHVHVRYMLSPIRLSSVYLSVTLVRPTHAVEIFGNISTPFGTLAIHWHPQTILRRSSQGNPSAGGVKHKRGSQI